MKKLIFILIAFPLLASAAWYNPFDWFGSEPQVGATPPITTFQGGTGTSSPSGILYADGTIRMSTVIIGSNLTFTGGTLSATGGSGLTNYNAFTHPKVGESATTTILNMAGFNTTASSTVNGALTVTGATNFPAGTISNTELAASTISGISLGNSLGALTAGDTTLTFSSSYDGSAARTVVANCSAITGSASLCDGVDNTGSGITDYNAFTHPKVGESATTSVMNLNGGFNASASSTALLLNVSRFPNLTSNGFIKTSGGNGALSIDTATYESGLTAGDGLTRTANDFDCDVASGTVAGCLASADWTTFNNKQPAGSYLTANQTITLSGDVSGSGATSISTLIGLEKILGKHLATSSNFANGEILTYTSATDDFEGKTCAEITGSADLCDGSDATGAGGGGLTNYDAFTHVVSGTSATSTEMRLTGGLISASTTASTLQVTGLLNASSSLLVGGVIKQYQSGTSTFVGGLEIETSGFVYDSSSNNVGIGTANAKSRLTVGATNGLSNKLVTVSDRTTPASAAGANGILVDINGGGGIYMTGDNGAVEGKYEAYAGVLGIGTMTNNPLTFHTNNSERARFAATGNFGIATTAPGSLLSIGDTTGWNFSTATSSSFATGGLNLNAGCFAIRGVCVGAGGSGTVTSIATNNGITGGTITTTGTIGLAAMTQGVLSNITSASAVPVSNATSTLYQDASATNPGLLLAADWTTFNNKQPAGSYLTNYNAFTHPVAGQSATTTILNMAGFNTTASSTVGGDLHIIGKINASSTATSTFQSGLNISTGCFAINGVCVGAGGSGTVTSIDSGSGLTGGPITTSGTFAVGAGTCITVNANDVAVTTNCTDATTLDSIDGASLLRSDTSDSYTSGTLTFSASTILDLTAATLVIPSGTAVVVDAVGEIGLDTTDNQLLIATSTTGGAVVYGREVQKLYSFSLASTSVPMKGAAGGGVATLPFPPEKDGYQVYYALCSVWGGTSVVINLTDGTNDTNTITCTTATSTNRAFNTNNTWTAGEGMGMERGTITGTVDYLNVSIFGIWTRE